MGLGAPPHCGSQLPSAPTACAFGTIGKVLRVTTAQSCSARREHAWRKGHLGGGVITEPRRSRETNEPLRHCRIALPDPDPEDSGIGSMELIERHRDCIGCRCESTGLAQAPS